jgi:hypothetical protein
MMGVINVSAVADKAHVKETTETWAFNKPVALQHPLTRQPSHMYYQLKSCKVFDCNSFFNQEGFTINYDEEHLLLSNCANSHLLIYHASITDGPVTVDTNNLPLYMCFKIRLINPYVSLNVGPHTPLSLLFNCAQLDIVQLALTLKQIIKIREPYNNHRYAENVLYNAGNDTKKSYQPHMTPPKRSRQGYVISPPPPPPPPPPPTTLPLPPLPPPLPPPLSEQPIWLNSNSPELSPA